MESEVDHYLVLGLPSAEEGSKLTDKDITKAYRLKALELHPDKRPDDPNAHDNFQKLKTSYEVLKDEKARKLFDDLLRVKREKIQRLSQHDAKRRKMMSDLDKRERSASDTGAKDRNEEEIISRKLKEEIARIRAMHSNKATTAAGPPRKDTKKAADESSSGRTVDREKVLNVSWEKIGEGYTVQKLRNLFEKFGGVEDLIIRTKKRKVSAVIVMASREAAVAATGNVLGDLSNPLLVLPLQAAQPSASPVFASPTYSCAEKDLEPKLSDLVGSGYEDSVLEKLNKAAQKKQ